MISDLNYLRTMSGGDSKFIAEMIGLFREQVDEYSVLMPQMLMKKDYDGLSKLAHKAKSSVAVMGMHQVADLLKDLEIMAHQRKEEERYEGMVEEFLQQSRIALEELTETNG
jgi:HPt (histidine-containing phosphotransfer) domain-containing protein